eukprot:g250.t1
MLIRRETLKHLEQQPEETSTECIRDALLSLRVEENVPVARQEMYVKFAIHTEGYGLFPNRCDETSSETSLYGYGGGESELRSIFGDNWQRECVFLDLLWLSTFGELMCTKMDDGSLSVVVNRFVELVVRALNIRKRGEAAVWRVNAMSVFESRRSHEVSDAFYAAGKSESKTKRA